MSLTHVSSAIATTGPLPFTYLYFVADCSKRDRQYCGTTGESFVSVLLLTFNLFIWHITGPSIVMDLPTVYDLYNSKHPNGDD